MKYERKWQQVNNNFKGPTNNLIIQVSPWKSLTISIKKPTKNKKAKTIDSKKSNKTRTMWQFSWKYKTLYWFLSQTACLTQDNNDIQIPTSSSLSSSTSYRVEQEKSIRLKTQFRYILKTGGVESVSIPHTNTTTQKVSMRFTTWNRNYLKDTQNERRKCNFLPLFQCVCVCIFQMHFSYRQNFSFQSLKISFR